MRSIDVKGEVKKDVEALISRDSLVSIREFLFMISSVEHYRKMPLISSVKGIVEWIKLKKWVVEWTRLSFG